jgi:ribose-phosphate pyrophosphokinase
MSMHTLNLVNEEISDIKFKVSHFPDGQQDVTITSYRYGTLSDIRLNEVTILSRFGSFKDLELIVAATKALRRLSVETIHLYIPYLLGARSDRAFVQGGTSYLVDVVAPIINSLRFKTVSVIDPHSDVAAACINNLVSIPNINLVKFTLTSLYAKDLADSGVDQFTYINNKILLVSPDAGSLKKVYKVAEAIGYTGDVIVCSKYRDTDGKLSKTHVPLDARHLDKDLIIIDDICDGGRTFINIVKSANDSLRETHTSKAILIVTHGIFSNGLKELSQHFDNIFCTNSYSAISPLEEQGLVKQLNVF